ncbi:MAG: ABC transporter ATP-binding protein [Haloarculaceae archaeon]
MTVELDGVTKRFDDLLAVDDVSLTIDDGEFLTLVGPSGCGKTTTLRCIAGLEDVSEGTIHFDGRDVTNLSPQQRNIAFVFQNYALYPHMTARRNMSFALEDQGMPDADIERKVAETAEMLGITEQLNQKPGELSGGQQQRVALGRSIVRDPDVFLLDEPLSNLDAKLRVQMRAELQKIHNELDRTMIYVTHDQEEAMTMSDRIAIMNQGRLQQVSPPAEAYYQPKNRFVASFIGSPAMNFIGCQDDGDRIETAAFSTAKPETVTETVGELGVRPEDIELSESEGDFGADVSVFEQLGSYNIVYLDVDGVDDEFIAQVPATKYFEPGDRVSVSVTGGRYHLFAGDGTAVSNPPTPSEDEQSQPGVTGQSSAKG